MMKRLKEVLGANRFAYSRGDISVLDFVGRPEQAEMFIAHLSHPWIEDMENVNGYVNVRVSQAFLKEALDWVYEPHHKGNVYVEYPSVNPNKPWHIGHLRNALIGESISRLAETMGYNVVRLDYINDLGLQMAEVIHYLREHPEEPNQKYDWFVGLIYIRAHQEWEEKEKEVRRVLKEMEENPYAIREFVRKVIKAQRQTARIYGVKTDWTIYESDLLLMNKSLLDELKKRGVLLPGGGDKRGTWVFPSGLVAIRSDGTYTYVAKDVLYQVWKYGGSPPVPMIDSDLGRETYKTGEPVKGSADWVLNVVGAEQSHEQNTVKEILSLLGYENYLHVAYGLVFLPHGKFSGRKGTWKGYTADELSQEALRKGPEEISISAVNFWMLKGAREKTLVFDWDKALSLKGDSGPYLQYSLVRARKILNNIKNVPPNEYTFNEEERRLIVEMAKFEEMLDDAWAHQRPSVLARYALRLAVLFSSFYEKHKVVGAEAEYWRAKVVKAYVSTMEKLLHMLVMKCPESM